jgi:hypothetical protein
LSWFWTTASTEARRLEGRAGAGPSARAIGVAAPFEIGLGEVGGVPDPLVDHGLQALRHRRRAFEPKTRKPARRDAFASGRFAAEPGGGGVVGVGLVQRHHGARGAVDQRDLAGKASRKKPRDSERDVDAGAA